MKTKAEKIIYLILGIIMLLVIGYSAFELFIRLGWIN
jgi:hypothetical protein